MSTKDINKFGYKVHDGSGTAEVQVGGNPGAIEDGFKADVSGKNQGAMQVGADGVKVMDAVQVQTHKDNNLGIQTSWGSPANLADALKNPDDFTVSIGGTRTTLTAALKARLINTDGVNISETPMQPPEPTQQTQAEPLLSEQGRNFLKQAERIAGPAVLNGVLIKAFVASTLDRSKSEAAIEALSSALHVEPERGEMIVNTLLMDTMQTVEQNLIDGYGGETAQAAIDFFMDGMSPEVKANLLHRFIIGDSKAIHEMVNRMQMKNKF